VIEVATWTLILSLASSGTTARTNLGPVPEARCWQIGREIADKFEAELPNREIAVECMRQR
jgi:hypothetical protein